MLPLTLTYRLEATRCWTHGGGDVDGLKRPYTATTATHLPPRNLVISRTIRAWWQ